MNDKPENELVNMAAWKAANNKATSLTPPASGYTTARSSDDVSPPGQSTTGMFSMSEHLLNRRFRCLLNDTY